MRDETHETPSKELSEISPATSEGSFPGSSTHSRTFTSGDTHHIKGYAEKESANEPRRGRSHSGQSGGLRESHETERTLSDEGHDAQVATPHRSRSRAQSSIRSIRKDAVVVPRGERRGLFARLAVIAEVTEPHDYTNKRKWMITFVVAVAAAAAPMGSSIILPALGDITKEFNSSPTVVNLSVAMYMLSMSIFPLWWSSFSETLGRRTIYLSSFVLFLIFNILSAVSTNIAMFIVTRLLSGGAAASVQAVGAGTIADVWEVKERGRAMGIFYLGPLCGPLISPILGGVLTQELGWRSSQWALAIFGALLIFFILFCLPETLATRKPLLQEAEAEVQNDISEKPSNDLTRPQLNRTTTTQSVAIKSKTYLSVLRRAFLDPLRIILYLRFPAVAICVAYASITFGSLYMLNISVQRTFSDPPYNYSVIIVGLLYIPNSMGYFIASLFGGRWVDNIMHREARKAGRFDERGRLKFIPEDRMQENAWLGALIFPAALIMYGWTARYGVNTAAPMIANFFFGVGSMLIFALVRCLLTIRKLIHMLTRTAGHDYAYRVHA
jgi:multidrug resistance protein